MIIVSVTDRKGCVRPLLEQAELIAAAGADMIVLREKDLPEDELLDMAASLKEICRRHRTEFCMDSPADVARAAGAETVWLPFRAFMESGRPCFRKVGVSVHSLEEGLQADGLGADFLVYGNVFETACKPGKPAKGLEEMETLAKAAKAPVYAIGGIGPGNIAMVRDRGASGACLMSGLMKSEDPTATILGLRRNLCGRLQRHTPFFGSILASIVK